MTGADVGRLLLARGAQAVAVAIVVGVVSFAMMETLPGDAAFRIAAGRYGYDVVDAAAAEAVRAELGLDAPRAARLLSWLGDLLTFDLGRSLVTGQSVREEVASQLGASVALAAAAFAVSLAIALPVGVAAGLRPGDAVDRASFAASVALRAVPTFALAVVLILVFAVRLRWLPVAGHGGPEHFALPALTLGLALGAVSSRVVRDAVAEVAATEHMRFARLKGLSDAAAMARHGPRNVAGPLAAYLSVQMALLVEGVVVVESVFAWPGIGHALVHALFGRDVPVVQGTALALGLGFVVLGATADLLGRLADPRPEALA